MYIIIPQYYDVNIIILQSCVNTKILDKLNKFVFKYYRFYLVWTFIFRTQEILQLSFHRTYLPRLNILYASIGI